MHTVVLCNQIIEVLENDFAQRPSFGGGQTIRIHLLNVVSIWEQPKFTVHASFFGMDMEWLVSFI